MSFSFVALLMLVAIITAFVAMEMNEELRKAQVYARKPWFKHPFLADLTLYAALFIAHLSGRML